MDVFVARLTIRQTGATVLALGYANFVIIPASDVFGRRVVLLICAAISLGSYIWQALATSYHSFLGARILNGIGAASNESIMTVVIADMCKWYYCGCCHLGLTRRQSSYTSAVNGWAYTCESVNTLKCERGLISEIVRFTMGVPTSVQSYLEPSASGLAGGGFSGLA